MSSNPHVTGKYTLAAALIASFATLGGIYLKYYLENSSLKEETKKVIAIDEDKTHPQSAISNNFDINQDKNNDRRRIAEMEINKLLSDFIGHWSKKELSNLTALLDSTFSYKDDKGLQSRENFLAEKKDLFKRKRYIKIDTSQVSIRFDDNTFNKGIVSYEQHYETDNYESRGNNTLHFKKLDGTYKIIQEEFSRNVNN